jgi:type IV fimbrial biogenesis protein FimT
MNMKQKETGATLIELTAALGLAAILMSMAVPNYQTFTLNNRMVAEFNTFTSALQVARSEAIRRNEDVTICVSNANGNDCGNTGNWEAGWIICADSECGTESLRVGDPLPAEYSLRSSNNFSSNSRITFSNDGTLANNDGRGTFTLCDRRGNAKAKAIILNAVGRTQRSFDNDDDNIVDNHDGDNVTCL